MKVGDYARDSSWHSLPLVRIESEEVAEPRVVKVRVVVRGTQDFLPELDASYPISVGWLRQVSPLEILALEAE